MVRPPGVSLLFFAATVGLFAAAIVHQSRPAGETAVSTDHGASHPASRDHRVQKILDTAPQSPTFDFTFNALDPAFELSQSAESLFDPSDDYWGLPREEGYEAVSAYCGSCHSLAIVMQQRASPVRWSELLDWMVEKQGMVPLRAEDERTVHAYLSRHFGGE